jgi:hypothetical protein
MTAEDSETLRQIYLQIELVLQVGPLKSVVPVPGKNLTCWMAPKHGFRESSEQGWSWYRI